MSHSDCPADYVEIRRAICPAKRERAAVEYARQLLRVSAEPLLFLSYWPLLRAMAWHFAILISLRAHSFTEIRYARCG